MPVADCTCGITVTRNAPVEEERKIPLGKRLASRFIEALLPHSLRVSAAIDWDQDISSNRFPDQTENYSELEAWGL